jgi:hypothetical protein
MQRLIQIQLLLVLGDEEEEEIIDGDSLEGLSHQSHAVGSALEKCMQRRCIN